MLLLLPVIVSGVEQSKAVATLVCVSIVRKNSLISDIVKSSHLAV